MLAAGDKAASLVERPAWITGIDHRIDIHQPGMRDLTVSPSTVLAAEGAGLGSGPVQVAELSAPFSPQEVILRDALGLDDSVEVNPSGGALAANPVMVTGLVRVIEAARQVNQFVHCFALNQQRRGTEDFLAQGVFFAKLLSVGH